MARIWFVASAVLGMGVFFLFSGNASAQVPDDDPANGYEKEGMLIENGTTFGYVGNNGVTASETALGEDDNRGYFVDDLTLQLKKDTFRFGGTLAFRMFPASPVVIQAPTGSMPREHVTTYRYTNDLALERIWMRYDIDASRILFGDMALTIGKGIAFSVGKRTQGWVDTSLRGAGFEYRKEGRFLLAGYGGATNAADVDPVTQSVLDAEPGDGVAALIAQIQLAEAIRIGAHGVYVEPRYDDAQSITPERLWVDQGPGIRLATAGGMFELRLGGISFYTEGNWQQHDNYRVVAHDPVRDETGAAVYSSLSWESGPYFRRIQLALTLEGIFYHRFLAEGTYRSALGGYTMESSVTYHRMPTLEPSWVVIRSLGNAAGGKMDASVFVKRTDTRFSLSSNVMGYLGGVGADGQWDAFSEVLTVHPLLSIEQKGRRRDASLTMTFGGRYEKSDIPTPGYVRSGYLWHGGVEGRIRIASRSELMLSSMLRRHRLGVMERNDDYWVSDNGLALQLNPHWRFGVSLQYSDELRGADRQPLQLGGVTSPASSWFPGGEIGYSGSGLFRSFSAVLQGGATRGGEKCVDGICRVFPNSAGFTVGVRYQL
ncbi:MAG: hypothetical protein JXX29_07630 [Deltaproteobacteria bacterium]|nr:hypothetical protein [Deltaproteobacteria bacterium]MBN2671527.1 hypothetical protein [Deltaproteobacteria bacterium]